MYLKKEGIFDHPPLTNESIPEPGIDNPEKGTKIINWIFAIGLIFAGCAIGYFIFKHFSSDSKEEEQSSTMYID